MSKKGNVVVVVVVIVVVVVVATLRYLGLCREASGCIPSKNKFKTQKNNKLRWLASDIKFKILHTGCPIARSFLCLFT